MKTQEIESLEHQLQAELTRLALEKQQAAEQEKAERFDQIAEHEDQANTYRNQAAKALNDEEKQRLYRYADDEDEQANELRKQLGLVSEEQLQASNAERQQAERLKTQRRINALLLKALFTMGAYLLADFTSAKLEVGFFSFALKSAAQLCYTVSGVFGGCWLVCTVLFGFVSDYCMTDLRRDFQHTNPAVRLALLAGLLASLIYLLTALVPNVSY